MTESARKRLEENCHVTHVGGNIYTCHVCFALTSAPFEHFGFHQAGTR